MTKLIVIVVAILTVVIALLVILNRTKVITIKNKRLLGSLYFVLVAGLIYLSLVLFGGTVWQQITAYRERVLSESEEECKKENAPYWCHL